MLLSTLIPDSDSQTDTSVVSRVVQSVRRKKISSKNTSRHGNKSTSRTKKSTLKSTVKSVMTEENDQADKALNGIDNNSMRINPTETSNSINIDRERHLSKPEHSRPFSPASTSSLIGRSISKEKQKLVNTVFSSITKRKSTNDDTNQEEEEEYVKLEGSVPCLSPPRQIAKKAKVIFQKCFESTFDPRMLPGHDIILVEDSDENNSD